MPLDIANVSLADAEQIRAEGNLRTCACVAGAENLDAEVT